MFVSSFEFSKLNSTVPKAIGQYKLIEHIYAFRGKTRKRYIVIVEEYDYCVYVVKFYLQERKVHKDRFQQLTYLNECSRVLTTVGKIMLEIYNSNPYASFGFIGMNGVHEAKANTKRFKLYSRVVSQLISPVAFEHRVTAKHSAYLLLSRDNQTVGLMEKIEVMFADIYSLEP
jgi:hypothetical protein